MNYPVVIAPLLPEDGGGYLSYAPDLRGCMSDGETPEEALANLKDAMLEWLDLYVERNPGVEPPAPNSAALAVQEERRHLADRLKEASQAHAQMDDRLNQLARDINDIRERIESIESWSRFAEIVPPQRDDGTDALLTH